MRSIILAAGRGSRLKELTKNKPKCLVKVKKRTLLDRIISNFKKNKISKICVITGYQNKLIKKKDILNIHNPIWYKTNMLYSLFLADKWLSKYTCVVSYSDILYHSDAIKIMKLDKNNISMISVKNWKKIWKLRFTRPLNDLESFKMDKNNFIKSIGFKEKSLSKIQGQYSGIFKITPPVWKRIRNEILKLSQNKLYKLDMTKFFQILLKKNFKIKIIEFKKNWFEFDTKKDLKAYEKL